MEKYNSKKTAKQPTETNFMGEKTFKLEDKEELVSTVMTTFLQYDYYEKENDKVKRIQNLLKNVDPLFAAKLAIYARNEGNLRSVTHLIAADIAKYIGGTDWSKRFYDKIVVRPDDMSEIVSAYANLNGMEQNDIKKIPNAMKKGFKIALERMDAYQLDKYKMKNHSVSMIDLIRLFHPKGTQKNAEAFKRLVEGKSLDGLYSSKIFEKHMTKAGQETKSATVQEKEEAKRGAISEVLDNINGMPIMNLIRNLRNIILYAPDKVDETCKQLTIEYKILHSHLLPFRFATAYSEIEKMKYNDKIKSSTEIAFESDKTHSQLTREKFNGCKKKVLSALEDAIQISCQNIPELEGNVAILIDHSGSCRGDGGGSSRVSAFSKVNTAMIGNLFGSMMAYCQDNVYIGLFGDKLIDVPMNRDKKILEFNQQSYGIGQACGGGTETGIYDFMRQCVNENKKVDNVIVFSDCQIGNKNSFTPWYGKSHLDIGKSFHELFKDFKKINPMCNWVVVNLRQSDGTSVFDKSQRILNISGWSEKIFDLIKLNTKGFQTMINEIEAIEI